MMNLRRDESGLMMLQAKGVLSSSDYERVMPELEKALEQGSKRILLELDGFRGFTPSALVKELRFDVRHRKDFDRVAVLADTFEDLGVRMIAPIFSGEIRSFKAAEREEAIAWLEEN